MIKYWDNVKRFLFVAILSGALVSCGSKTSSEEVVAGETKTQAETNQLAADNLAVSTSLSKIYWKGFKPGGGHHGTLSLREGELNIQDEAIIGGRFVIEMKTIVCDDLTGDNFEKLTNHLKSSDFFDVKQFPTGEFIITSVTPKEGAKQNITGNLTLKGITKSISFPVELSSGKSRFMVTTTDFTIDRTQWNINYGSKNIFKNLKDSFINDEIEVKIVVVSEQIDAK